MRNITLLSSYISASIDNKVNEAIYIDKFETWTLPALIYNDNKNIKNKYKKNIWIKNK